MTAINRLLMAAAIVALAGCRAKAPATLQHVRYEKNGREIGKQEWSKEFEKNPAAVQECVQDKAGKVICAAG